MAVATRSDLVKHVNHFIRTRGYGKPLRDRDWRRAVQIARQNKLMATEKIDAIAKHGDVNKVTA